MQSVGVLGDKSILGDKATAMWGIVMVDVWQWTPLIVLITLAGLKRVPIDQLEANMVDGAGEIRNFFQVTLPNIYRTHRWRAGEFDENTADLFVRCIVYLFQTRARCCHCTHPAGCNDHTRNDTGEGV